jgi:hypothetical protein
MVCRNRKVGKSGRDSEGVSVFIRKNIQVNIYEMVSIPECIIILSIGDKDLLLVATCITPRRVAYHEACYTFILEKINICGNHKKVLVIGDLNARVGEVNEFVPPYDFLNVDPQVNNEVIHKDYDFAPAPIRRNRDRTVTSSGRKCLDFCKKNSFIILNGPYEGDRKGKKTFKSHKGSSTIDLFISSPEMWADVIELKVIEEGGMSVQSDHCPVHVILNMNVLRSAPPPMKRDRPCTWSQENWGKYAEEAHAMREELSEVVRRGCFGGRWELEIASVSMGRILTGCCRIAFWGMETQGNRNGKESWWDEDFNRARNLEKKTLKAIRKGRVCKEQLRIVRKVNRSMENGKQLFLNIRYDKKSSSDFEVSPWESVIV